MQRSLDRRPARFLLTLPSLPTLNLPDLPVKLISYLLFPIWFYVAGGCVYPHGSLQTRCFSINRETPYSMCYPTWCALLRQDSPIAITSTIVP